MISSIALRGFLAYKADYDMRLPALFGGSKRWQI